MRVSILILCFLLPLCMNGQQVKMQGGKIFADGKLYAVYDIDGTKKNNIPFTTGDIVPENNPEISGTDFYNVRFGTPATSEQYIFATAKVLASPANLYLAYYYNIRFPLIGKELNITYHPFLIEYFARDIVKYNVFNEGYWNEDAALKLHNAWAKKMSVLSAEQLAAGKSIYYNNSELILEAEDNTMNVSVKGNNIYIADTLFGSYHLSKKIKGTGMPGTAKGNYLYEIEDKNGKELALFRVPVMRSVSYLQPVIQKDYLEIITPERNEEKLIAIACKALLASSFIK